MKPAPPVTNMPVRSIQIRLPLARGLLDRLNSSLFSVAALL